MSGRAQVDTSGMSLEQGLFKSFDDMVRRQLDSVWHTVTIKTKQVGLFVPYRQQALCATP